MKSPVQVCFLVLFSSLAWAGEDTNFKEEIVLEEISIVLPEQLEQNHGDAEPNSFIRVAMAAFATSTINNHFLETPLMANRQ
jgi:hypothetical protein